MTESSANGRHDVIVVGGGELDDRAYAADQVVVATGPFQISTFKPAQADRLAAERAA